MWPMLLELLPHFARLMPMADKYLNNGRGATDKAHDAALATLAETVHGDLGQVVEVHSGIQRALKEQAAQISEIAVEGTRTRLGVESIEARVAKLEQTAATTTKLLAVALLMLTGTLALLGVLLAHQMAH
jgi:hypothetical protein